MAWHRCVSSAWPAIYMNCEQKSKMLPITKPCLCNYDPIKPHFYIVKLGFTGVYVVFLISTQNIDCGYSLKPPRRGGSNEYHNLCFEQKFEKYQIFLSENFQFLEVKFSIYLNRFVFEMIWKQRTHKITKPYLKA